MKFLVRLSKNVFSQPSYFSIIFLIRRVGFNETSGVSVRLQRVG